MNKSLRGRTCTIIKLHIRAEGQGDTTIDQNDNYFLAGGVTTGNVSLSPDGWRITKLRLDNIWKKGTGFMQLTQTKR